MKLIKLLLIATLLAWPIMAHATAGCTLSIASNPKVTAQYGITIIVFSPALTTVLGPGVAGEVVVQSGDLVLVQTANYTCGTLAQIFWGYTRWSPCGISGPLIPASMEGDFTNDWYIGNAICNCPQPGQGILDDLMNGTRCTSQQPPPQQ